MTERDVQEKNLEIILRRGDNKATIIKEKKAGLEG